MSLITVKEAVSHAKESLINLYEDDPAKELALEEIELIKEGDRDLWAVTLGFHRPKRVTEIAGGAFRMPSLTPPQIEHRVYKTVIIDALDGAFVRMDMRQVS
jgi:hypothetical protein